MVKTEKTENLGPKFCTPTRFLEAKIRANRGYGTRLRLPLSYSLSQRPLLHQTLIYGAKLAFFDILLNYVVKFLLFKVVYFMILSVTTKGQKTVHSRHSEPRNNHPCSCL